MAMSIPFTATAVTRTRAARERITAWLARAGRTSRIARARAGYTASATCSAWGVGVLWGFGWALLVGGMVGAWSFLHLYPVDEP